MALFLDSSRSMHAVQLLAEERDSAGDRGS